MTTARPELPPPPPARSVPAIAGMTVAMLLIAAVIDHAAGLTFNASIAFPAVLLLTWLSGRRWVAWACFALAVVLIGVVGVMENSDTRAILHRVTAAVTCLAATLLIDRLVAVWVQNAAVAAQLRRAFDDAAAREEEIARQNEELQSQTEELERQSEELRVTNEELARREKMLEALLDLARSLRAESHQDETMSRICEGLSRLVGPTAAAAIVQKRDGHVQVVCHHGFGAGGVANDVIPYDRSFASLILDRGRTGYLEDLSLRPDLEVAQPKSGPRHQSILAAPLVVGGKVFGSLELYGRERVSWSDEQVALVESLAAQASISLEAARLFDQVDRERGRLQAVLTTVPLGIAISNADYSDVRLNPYGAMLLGTDPAANAMAAENRDRLKTFRDGRPIPPEQFVLPRALRGETVSAEEVEVVVPGGRRLVLLLSAAPIRDKGGAVTGAVSAFADITARKQLERELDARRREAEESSVRKSRFLAAVSHDIRTPANAISLLAELIQRTSSTPELAGETPQLAKELQASALSLVNLVSDVLDVTRLDSGKIELTETEFSLAQLLGEECTQLIPLARVKGLELECHTPEQPVYIRADRVKLGRVLSNLINNAIKFTEAGRVTVTGEADDGIVIRVTDTGPGIPAEALDRIFDEFFQLKHRSAGQPGSGLGLTICRRLVDAMGGTLVVESEVGKGSTFTLTLPAKALAPAPAGA